MTYGKRLDAALKHAKKSRKELADVLGCTPQAIGIVINWAGENDRKLETESHSEAAHFLKVSDYWLATGKGDMELPSNQPLAPVDTAQSAMKTVATLEQITETLAGYLMQMDDDGRDDAGDVLRKLAHKPENHTRAAAMLGTAFHSGKRKAA
jgi:hypothetical protein